MRRWTWLIAVVAGLLVAAPAAAAPLDLGPGERPSVLVDGAGTAHIAFQSGGAQIYCRLPRNAKACDIRTALPLAGEPFLSGPKLLQRGDGALLMIVSTNERLSNDDQTGITYLRGSGDGGATWSAPTPIATGTYSHAAVALAPDGQSIYTLDPETGALEFQRAPFTGGERRDVNLAGTVSPGDDARLAVLPDGRILVVDGRLNRSDWRLFGGGDVFDINAWGKRGTVKTWETEFATGPRGTFLLDHRPLADQRLIKSRAPFSIRSFDTRRNRWRAVKTAGADRSIFGSSSFLQDARGRLHIAADTGGATRTTCVLYTRTGPKNSQWFGRTTVLYKTNSTARAPRRVAGRRRPGRARVVVWDDGGPSGQAGNVRVMPLKQAKGKYRPKRFQGDRPACTGRRY